MKNLFLALVATVLIGGASFGQADSNIEVKKSDAQSWVELTAKFHLMITFLETKEEMRESRSNSEFHTALTEGITNSTFANDFRPLSDYVYSLHNIHSESNDFNVTYDQIDPRVAIELIKKMSKYDRSELEEIANDNKGRFLNGIKKFAQMIIAIVEAIEDFIDNL